MIVESIKHSFFVRVFGTLKPNYTNVAINFVIPVDLQVII
jgi:hypothetical protein